VEHLTASSDTQRRVERAVKVGQHLILLKVKRLDVIKLALFEAIIKFKFTTIVLVDSIEPAGFTITATQLARNAQFTKEPYTDATKVCLVKAEA
jgi:hypothetical protein